MKSWLLAGAASVAIVIGSAPSQAVPITFSYTGAIANYVIADTGYYEVTALGAQGGSGWGGGGFGARGAQMGGVFYLHAGDTLSILVGGKGIDAFGDAISHNSFGSGGGGGGGGSFVTVSSLSMPLVVAGGGGGAPTGDHGFPPNGGTPRSGTTSQNGTSGTKIVTCCGNGRGDGGAGGTAGAGGGGGDASQTSFSSGGGGGGGFLTNGGNAHLPDCCINPIAFGGKAFQNGGAGGTAASSGTPGGFGGGGAGGNWVAGGGGGGGGFSGGGGGGQYGGGGGGGSYLNVLALADGRIAQGGYRTGNGLVTLNLLALPEPSTMLGFGTALAGLGFARGKRRKSGFGTRRGA